MPALIREGKLRAEYVVDRVLKHPGHIAAPDGTRSQIIRYLDAQGEMLVEVHQYLLPDGSLGATGRPDPKRMRVGDEIWKAKPSP